MKDIKEKRTMWLWSALLFFLLLSLTCLALVLFPIQPSNAEAIPIALHSELSANYNADPPSTPIPNLQWGIIEDVIHGEATNASEVTERLSRFRPLTSAQWTLVDAYECNGTRYIVARENQANVRGLARLSSRERQAVAYVAAGQSTKETAYALGISANTVRVLLARAAAKLGAKTRGSSYATRTYESSVRRRNWGERDRVPELSG